MPMRLAVCAEMMFLDLPITERVKRIAEAGLDAEIWDWTRHAVEDLAASEAMAVGGAAGRPSVQPRLDRDRAQIGEGNVMALVRRAGPVIGEIQVEDVRGRCEHGSGESK